MMCLREGVKFMKKANILVLIMIVMSIVISLNGFKKNKLCLMFEEKVHFLQVPSIYLNSVAGYIPKSINLSIPFDE